MGYRSQSYVGSTLSAVITDVYLAGGLGGWFLLVCTYLEMALGLKMAVGWAQTKCTYHGLNGPETC